MMTPGDRLKQAREAAGYRRRTAAAARAGVSYSTFGAHENGQNGISPDMADIYARAFGVDRSWLLFGDSAQGATSPLTQTPGGHDLVDATVVGWVESDVWQDSGSIDPGQTNRETRVIAPHPRYPNATHIIFDVRGDRFDQLAPNGSQIVCVPFGETGLVAPLNGQIIVTEHGNQPFDGDDDKGPVMRIVSRVRELGVDEKWLDPESNNPSHQPRRLDHNARPLALVVQIIHNLTV